MLDTLTVIIIVAALAGAGFVGIMVWWLREVLKCIRDCEDMD